MSIRIGILGYGNLGRGVECAVRQNDDMELVADLGSVHVNNRSESTHFRQSGDAGKLSVNTSVGSVRLSY